MNSNYFDTVIIGGGPSGSACGITLKKHNASCCIIDRKKFPRNKLCAGLLTTKTQQVIFDLLSPMNKEDILKDITFAEEKHFKLYNKEELLIDVELTPGMQLVNRIQFDNYLLDYYKKLGGTTFEGEAVKDINFETKEVTLLNEQIIRYKYLVAADGANSIVGKYSHHQKSENALCAEINIGREDLDIHGIKAYFNIVPDSYAWVFSKGKQISIGMVKLPGKEFNLLNTFSGFLKQLGLNPEKYQTKGAMLPFGNYLTDPTYGNSVLFVGDAGGFVEPLTGEGIYYALKTGSLAGESILSGDPCITYRNNCKPIVKVMKNSNKYQKLFASRRFMNFFYKHLPRHWRFVRYFYNTHINRCSTDSFIPTCLKYLLRDRSHAI